MQLIAGRTAQEYNYRKARKGAFWDDRYHATAVEANAHLIECLIYIDMNMVRAAVVTHPKTWAHGGYQEIQQLPRRYRIVDIPALMKICEVNSPAELQFKYRHWIEVALAGKLSARDDKWSQSIAVGSKQYVERVKENLGIKAVTRRIIEDDNGFSIKEGCCSYNDGLDHKKGRLSSNNNCNQVYLDNKIK